jgi:hypothetical protein
MVQEHYGNPQKGMINIGKHLRIFLEMIKKEVR